ncbi:hypothetical protein B566_EDAN004300 [Ephemera danica]|nr:hypothetical protein B566_EDAN004300 [Ephemera danica]
MYQQGTSSVADYSWPEQDDSEESEEEEEDDEECGVCGQSSCECGDLAALLLAQPQAPPFPCTACHQWFVVHDKLVLHLVLNHSMVYCKFCKKLFTSQAEHTVCTSHPGSAPCSTCGLQFRTDSSTCGHELAQHEARVHDAHACPLCGVTLQPHDALVQHVRRRHLCENLPELSTLGLISESPDNTWAFQCRLCDQQTPRSDLFTHFHSHHRLSLPCLIELLHCGRTFIPVSGYQSDPPQEGTCTVCSRSYTSLVPKTVHDVLCSGMGYCQYCSVSFPSGLARELHVVRAHSSLPCVACGESFPAETSLTAHHARAHGSVLCCCCDALDHLATRHACRALPPTPQQAQQEGMMCCSLCEERFCSNQTATSLFSHLCQQHAVVPAKALNLLLTQQQQVKNEEPAAAEPSETLTFPTDPEWPGCEEEEVVVPQVDLPSSEESEDVAGCSSDEGDDISQHGEPEVDPEDVDCVSDSSDDEDVAVARLACELCTESALGSPRALCAHLHAAHRMHWDRKAAVNDTAVADTHYACHRCNHGAGDKLSLARHWAQAHPGEGKGGSRCLYCPQRFLQSPIKDQHQLSSHAEHQRSFYRCPFCQMLSSSTRPHTGVNLKCRVCLLLFRDMTELRAHFRATHPAAMVFRCRHCGAHLKTRKTLRHHLKVVHAEARRRDCATCGKVLWSKRAYAIHYRMKHSKTSKVGFRCRICQQRFDTKEQRKLHYTLDHEGESPYHCADCGKGFASKSGMYGHRQLHTGSGVSKCEYCGKEFTRKDSYNEHLLIHNGPRHKCPHCPKEFVQRSNLVRSRISVRSVRSVSRTKCGKGFNSEKYLQRHVAIVHEPSNAFSCPLCKKTFSQQARLKAHLMTHSGVKHMKCLLCEKAYSVRKSLRRHLLEKHEVSPEHPQYKHCFHAMSPEEAGIEGLTAATSLSTTSPRRSPKREPPGSTRKRRRVEQIVQSLQHSLQAEPSSSSTPTLARINPLVVNMPRGRKRGRPAPPPMSSEDSSSDNEGEGLNLTVGKTDSDS